MSKRELQKAKNQMLEQRLQEKTNEVVTMNDQFIANDTQRNFVYFNNHDGTFEDASYFSGAGFSEDGKAEAGMSAGAAQFRGHDGRGAQ